MKYPIGIQDFKSIREGNYVYVDKTAMVYHMVHNGEVYFLSRPRRFGKSLLVSTLKSYFDGNHELFCGLEIEKLEKEWIKYPIFHIDFNSNDFTIEGTLQNMLLGYVSKWEKQYGLTPDERFSTGERFSQLLEHVHETTGQRCVVLVDEYDKPLLDVMDVHTKVASANGITLEEYNRNTLKGFYSSFKAADAHLRFVLLTGVTKFSQVSIFSGFNQPNDISMDSRYETLCGISEDELEHYFKSDIGALADELSMTYEDAKSKLKTQYDGYHFSRRMKDIYNPFSLFNALDKKELGNYWFATGTPTFLVKLLAQSNENLNELTGRYYDVSDFVDYRADELYPLPIIYQSGYLTLKAYDVATNSYLLDFPNNEVKDGFVTACASDYLLAKSSVKSTMIDFVRDLNAADLEQLKLHLTSFFASIPYTMRRKDDEKERERYFHYTFYLIFRLLSSYLVLTEKEQSQGRADCIIETPTDVFIFEFKLDASAGKALEQIEKKGYATSYKADQRIVHKIGVSFSSQTGTIEDWQEA